MPLETLKASAASISSPLERQRTWKGKKTWEKTGSACFIPKADVAIAPDERRAARSRLSYSIEATVAGGAFTEPCGER